MSEEFQWVYWNGFRIIVQLYFVISAFLILTYSWKHRKDPVRAGEKKIIKQEFIIGISFILIAFFLPKLYANNINDLYVRAQAFFHLWDSLTVQYILWMFYLWGAKVNNRKFHRNISYTDWKEQIKIKHQQKNPVKSDFQRKLLHLFPPLTLLGLYYIGILMENWVPELRWDRYSISTFFASSISFGYMYIMFIFDYIRLRKFKLLGKFAHDWAESSIHPKELNTFNSAIAMSLGFAPFYAAPIQVMIATVLVASVADAMASIIGKRFGKHRFEKSGKTLEGYVAGFLTSFSIVIAANFFLSFTEASIPIGVTLIMASGAAIGFLLVDLFAVDIPDNFLNPLISGGIIWILYSLLI